MPFLGAAEQETDSIIRYEERRDDIYKNSGNNNNVRHLPSMLLYNKRWAAAHSGVEEDIIAMANDFWLCSSIVIATDTDADANKIFFYQGNAIGRFITFI